MKDAKAKAYAKAADVLKVFIGGWTESPSRQVADELWEIAEALERAAKARSESSTEQKSGDILPSCRGCGRQVAPLKEGLCGHCSWFQP